MPARKIWCLAIGPRCEMRWHLDRTLMKRPAGSYGWTWGGLVAHLVQYQIQTDDFSHMFRLFPLSLIVRHCRSESSVRASSVFVNSYQRRAENQTDVKDLL